MTDTGDDDLRQALAALVKQLTREEPLTRGTPLLGVLDEHLGMRADELPVVVEKIDLHRWVDVDIALAEVAARDG
ncbi:hypothetical protein, partial [Nocardioides sp. P5_C9_2]